MLTCWLVQEKERGIERRRKIESKTESRRGIFALYEAPSCSLAARRHLTLTLFVPATPKVNDFTHYCKWCLVFTLSHRRNEYSRPLLFSGFPEVRLYVKISPKTDSKQSSEEDNNIAKTSVMMVWTALSVCSQHARVLVKLLTRSSLPGHITNNWPSEYQSQPSRPLPDTPESQSGC